MLEQIKNVTYSLSHFLGGDLNFMSSFKAGSSRKTTIGEQSMKFAQTSDPCSLHTGIQVTCDGITNEFNVHSSTENQFADCSQSRMETNTFENLVKNGPQVYFNDRQKEFVDIQETFDGEHKFQVQTSYSKHPVVLDDGINTCTDDEFQVEEHIFEQIFALHEDDLDGMTLNMNSTPPAEYIYSARPLTKRLQLEEQLLQNRLIINPGHVLHQCIVYLAPGDYHRFHSPTDWTVYTRRHFTGNLFSVNPSMAGWLQGLFTINERVLYVGRWRYGFFSMTAVGATNVGSISAVFDQKLRTNEYSEELENCAYNEVNFKSREQHGIHLKQGHLMGEFNLGSTIVLMFEAPPGFKLRNQPGDIVRYGQGMVDGVRRLKNNKNRPKKR